MLRSRSLTPIAILAAICASGAGASDLGPMSGGLIGSWQGGSGAAYLGKLSSNRYDPESISNPYGRYGSPYGDTLANPASAHASPYRSRSWSNPYATDAPRIYAADGSYLGKLSTNRYDPESISNPYGRYGSPYGNTLANPFSKYGSPYSSESWRNPYTMSAPRIFSFSR